MNKKHIVTLTNKSEKNYKRSYRKEKHKDIG